MVSTHSTCTLNRNILLFQHYIHILKHGFTILCRNAKTCTPHHYWTAIPNISIYICNWIFIHFYFALKRGANGIRGFKITFQQLTAIWEHKKRRLPASTKSAESLYLSLFPHILRGWIVSKCGFTYLCKSCAGLSHGLCNIWWGFRFETRFVKGKFTDQPNFLQGVGLLSLQHKNLTTQVDIWIIMIYNIFQEKTFSVIFVAENKSQFSSHDKVGSQIVIWT